MIQMAQKFRIYEEVNPTLELELLQKCPNIS
jgi:hypothetical protein